MLRTNEQTRTLDARSKTWGCVQLNGCHSHDTLNSCLLGRDPVYFLAKLFIAFEY